MLKAMAAPYGIQVIFVDMRYGVRDENTLDHMTWLACKAELKSCFNESSGMYFLSLQSSKYGYQPIPKYIPQGLLDEIYATLPIEEQALLREWYHLDTNNVPSRYILKNLINVNDDTFWKEAFPTIKKCLADLAFDDDDDNNVLIGRSVTEYEAKVAMNLDGRRMRWMARLFSDGVDDKFAKYWDYNDTMKDASAKKKLDDLLALMHSQLEPLSNVIPMEISFDSYVAKDDQFKSYQAKWKDIVTTMFTNEVNSLISRRQQWKQNSFGLGYEGQDIDEMLHHCKIASDKCRDFSGREDLIEQAMSFITSNESPANKYKTSLCLVGVSGSGKTALMSKLASLTREKFDKVPVIIRFCGTSGESATGLGLINSICKQIQLLYNHKGKPVSTSYVDAVKYFHSLLSSYPVNLFIDSLDQLSNDNQARAKISFLDGAKIHKDSCIVVSALPDEREKGYFYQCDFNLAKAEVPRITVDAIADPQAIVSSLLSYQSRTLTNDQMKYLLSQAAFEPTALYLRLAMKVAKDWTSFQEKIELTQGVRGLCNQLFDTLERDFGQALVRAMLGLLTFSVGGLNINHVQDLLSLDDEVKNSTFQYSQPNKLQIPLHVIQRLYQALDELVVEREDGKINWYHRQLKEAACDRYKSDEKKHRLLMATYFGNLVDKNLRDERLVSEQPMVFGNYSVWFEQAIINKTACIECVSHMLSCDSLNMLVAAYKMLCDLAWICASIKAGEGHNLILQLLELEKLLKQFSGTSEILTIFRSHGTEYDVAIEQVRHYLRWLLLDMSRVITNPCQMIIATATQQPFISKVRLDALTLIEQTSGISDFVVSNDSSDVWFRGKCLGGPHSFDSCLMEISGHKRTGSTNRIYSVSISPDGSKIVSACINQLICVWDSITGAELFKLDGHNGKFGGYLCVSFSRDGLIIGSGSSDKTVRIWCAVTGAELHKLDHADEVTSISFSFDKIASGSADKMVRVWCTVTGKEIQKLEGHTDKVTAVSFSLDGSKIVSTSRKDMTVRIWDIINGVELLKIDTRSSSVSFSHKGDKIVSGSYPEYSGQLSVIYIFDVVSGKELQCLKGKMREDVNSVAFSQEDDKIVSGSNDCTIRIWDVVTGKEVRKFDNKDSKVYSVSLSGDSSKVFSGSDDGILRVWDCLAEETELLKYDGHKQIVRSVALCGSKIVSGSEDKAIIVWDIDSGAECLRIDGEDDIYAVAISPDGSKIASGGKCSSVMILCAITGSKLLKKKISRSVMSLSFSHESSRLAFTAFGEIVIVLDCINGEELLKIDYNADKVLFSPCGSKIVTAGKIQTTSEEGKKKTVNGVTVLCAVSGNELSKLKLDNSIDALTLSTDGSKILLKECWNSMIVWNYITGAQQTIPCSKDIDASCISLSPCGSKILTGYRTSIRIFCAVSGKEQHKIDVHTDSVRAVLLTPCGKKIISGSVDGTVRIITGVRL